MAGLSFNNQKHVVVMTLKLCKQLNNFPDPLEKIKKVKPLLTMSDDNTITSRNASFKNI